LPHSRSPLLADSLLEGKRIREAMASWDTGASLYEPINVYKPIAPDIGIVDGPFEYLTAAGIRLPLPFTTRMTVVRLSNGDLFLHSPVRFEQRLANKLHGLGTVRHLVSPNQFHYAHIGEWARAFPETISWASPRVRQRARATARGYRLYKRPRRQCARRVARGDRPTAFSRRLFQGIHFLSQGFKDADTHGYDRQQRIGQDFRALANGSLALRDVSSLWANILRHAATATLPAAEGEGGDQKDPLM